MGGKNRGKMGCEKKKAGGKGGGCSRKPMMGSTESYRIWGEKKKKKGPQYRSGNKVS